MKLSSFAALLGSVLCGSLVACGGSDDKSDTASAEAATKPATDADKSTPAPSSDPGSTTAPAPTTTDPGATPTGPAPDPTTPAPVADGPETCDTLAAKAQTPAGKLTMVTDAGGNIDVYATDDGAGALTIVLTKTANTCAYRKNNLQAMALDETSFLFRSNSGKFEPGDFKIGAITHESGNVCMPDDFQGGGFTGTAWSGGGGRGKVSITAKTDTQVDGTVDVTDFNGTKTTFTFSAPICKSAQEMDRDVTCCSK